MNGFHPVGRKVKLNNKSVILFLSYLFVAYLMTLAVAQTI
jgi:hypothetical protein